MKRGSISRSSWTNALSSLCASMVSTSRPDHGYPARVILPNVPGTHNIKWVGELRFEAA